MSTRVKLLDFVEVVLASQKKPEPVILPADQVSQRVPVKNPLPPRPGRAPRITNKQFSQKPEFIAACGNAGIPPTPRQASKFRNKRGAAWKGKK